MKVIDRCPWCGTEIKDHNVIKYGGGLKRCLGLKTNDLCECPNCHLKYGAVVGEIKRIVLILFTIILMTVFFSLPNTLYLGIGLLVVLAIEVIYEVALQVFFPEYCRKDAKSLPLLNEAIVYSSSINAKSSKDLKILKESYILTTRRDYDSINEFDRPSVSSPIQIVKIDVRKKVLMFQFLYETDENVELVEKAAFEAYLSTQDGVFAYEISKVRE